MSMYAWAKKARAVSFGCLLITSLYLITPYTVHALSWSEIPVIGVFFERPRVDSLEVVLQTKLPDDTEWHDTLANVGPGNSVQFKITLSNNSSYVFKNLRIVNVSEKNIVWEQNQWYIERLGRKGTYEVEVIAKANAEGINLSEEKCVLSVASLIYNNKTVSHDAAKVCITHEVKSFGDVLGSSTVGSSISPSTGIIDEMRIFTIPIVTFIGGLLAYGISLSIEKRFL